MPEKKVLVVKFPPEISIALVGEQYLDYHSRGSSSAASRDMSKQLNPSSQRNQTLLLVSQEARQVDRNIASSAWLLILKDLGMLQPEFDRPELKKVVGQARDAMSMHRVDNRKRQFTLRTRRHSD